MASPSDTTNAADASDGAASDEPIIIDDPAASLAELRAENERLRAELDALAPDAVSRRRSGRARRVGVVVVLVIAIVLGVAANLATWLQRTALDTDEFVGVTRSIARSEDVTDALAFGITERLFERVDAEEIASNALPDNAQALAAPLAGAVRNYTEDAVREVLRTDEFETVWTESVRLAHQTGVAVVTGRGDLARAEDGRVVLDLDALVERVLERLDERGLSLFEDGVPVELGTFVLFESDQLATAQRSVEILDRLATWLPLLAIAALVAVLLVADDRRRAAVQVGLAVAAAMAISLIVVRLGRREALGRIVIERRREAADDVWDAVIDGFRQQTIAMLLLGLVIAAGAWLIGPSTSAARVRSLVSRTVGPRGEREAAPGVLPPAVTAFAAARRNLLQGGIVVAAFVLLIVLPKLTPFIVGLVALVTLVAVVVVAAVAARHVDGTDAGGDSVTGSGAPGGGTPAAVPG